MSNNIFQQINELLQSMNTSDEHYENQERRNINLIRDLLDDYNNQINTYQSNISDIILLLRENQTNIYNRRTVASRGITQNINSINRNVNQTTNRNVNQTTNRNSRTNSIFFPEEPNILTDELFNQIYSLNIPPTGRRQQYRSIIRQNFLSQTQINIATRIIPYTLELNTIDTKCPISLNDFIIGENVCQIKYCSHIFNPTEISRWFNRNNVCPVCRYDLRTYVNPQLNDEINNLQQPNVDVNIENETQQNLTTEEQQAGIYRPLESSLINIFRTLNNNSRIPIDSLTFEIPLYYTDLSYNNI
jgi:hypothetical protein